MQVTLYCSNDLTVIDLESNIVHTRVCLDPKIGRFREATHEKTYKCLASVRLETSYSVQQVVEINALYLIMYAIYTSILKQLFPK